MSTASVIFFVFKKLASTHKKKTWPLNKCVVTRLYRTSEETNDRLTEYGMEWADINNGNNEKTDFTVSIDRSLNYQKMMGFGGAFTQSAAYVFFELNDTLQNEVLEMYWGSNGHKYSMSRLTIGSSDFSLESYDYNENDAYDYEQNNFKLAPEDLKFVIPLIKKAQDMIDLRNGTPIYHLGTPWSAPGWMKENGQMVCGDAGCDTCRLTNDASVYESWAHYFVKYVDSYKNNSILIWGITVQNEPGYCPVSYEGMHWDASGETSFISNYLGPILKEAYGDINIFIYDHNKADIVEWVQTCIVNDPLCAQYVTGTAFHWYDGDHFDALAQAHNMAPDYLLLASEATESYGDPYNPVWSKGEHYAHDILGDLNNWSVGWIDWNLMLDILGGPRHLNAQECEDPSSACGCDAMLLIDTQNNLIYPQVFYWYMGHFSRFIDRGDTRIGWHFSNNTDHSMNSDVEITAFINPILNSTSLIILNPTDYQYTIMVIDPQSIFNGMQLNWTIPAHSMQTLVY